MRLDFNYIIVDDDLKRSNRKRRVKELEKRINDKIRSKGLIPKPNLYKSLEDFYRDESNLDINRYDLYLSDNNLGNSGSTVQQEHANDGIELYLALHSRFLCDFILYTGSTQDVIIDRLVHHLKEKRDPGLFTRFTFVSRSSDRNVDWQGSILNVIDYIISSREEMNTMRGFYAQLTSQIHYYLKEEFNNELDFSPAIGCLNKRKSNYGFTRDDIDKLHKIRKIRNGLMHNDERKCETKPHTHYLVYYLDKENTIEKRIYIEDFDTVRKDLRDMYEKICTAFKIA